ncbi:MAG: hypothetical protein WDN45_02800 [Caulobacteraceae bacterium]
MIRHVDVDPLKTDIPLWYLPTTAAYTADSLLALKQLNAALEHLKVDEAKVKARRAHWAKGSSARRAKLEAARGHAQGRHHRAPPDRRIAQADRTGRRLPQRKRHQLPGGVQPPGPHRARHLLHLRRRIAGLERRGGGWA